MTNFIQKKRKEECNNLKYKYDNCHFWFDKCSKMSYQSKKVVDENYNALNNLRNHT